MATAARLIHMLTQYGQLSRSNSHFHAFARGAPGLLLVSTSSRSGLDTWARDTINAPDPMPSARTITWVMLTQDHQNLAKDSRSTSAYRTESRTSVPTRRAGTQPRRNRSGRHRT